MRAKAIRWTMTDGHSGEFQRISAYFAPLAAGAPGALGLTDDAAVFALDPGMELVTTVDTIVEGVHFIGDETPADIARKASRTNLSDLASMGARPLGYFLSLSVPKRVDDTWIADFCAGLAADQEIFGWSLMGGDSTSTPGPVSISITAMGQVPAGQALRRSGAKVGDAIFVSGTIGNGHLGLLAAQSQLGFGEEIDWLAGRYRVPQPRTALGEALRGNAHAVMDISDGLVADLGHLCRASGVAAQIIAPSVPLSDAAAEVIAEHPALFAAALTGGDDYELLITGPADAIEAAALESQTQVTKIGEIVVSSEGEPVVQVRDSDGVLMRFAVEGFRHG